MGNFCREEGGFLFQPPSPLGSSKLFFPARACLSCLTEARIQGTSLLFRYSIWPSRRRGTQRVFSKFGTRSISSKGPFFLSQGEGQILSLLVHHSHSRAPYGGYCLLPSQPFLLSLLIRGLLFGVSNQFQNIFHVETPGVSDLESGNFPVGGQLVNR